MCKIFNRHKTLTSIGMVDDLNALIQNPDYTVMWDQSAPGNIRVDYHPERAKARAEFNALSPEQKMAIGREQGFGACMRCGNTWNWKKGHSLKYNESGGGMFPLCEECWSESSPMERYAFCQKLEKEWCKETTKEIDWNIVSKECGVKNS